MITPTIEGLPEERDTRAIPVGLLLQRLYKMLEMDTNLEEA